MCLDAKETSSEDKDRDSKERIKEKDKADLPPRRSKVVEATARC